jgi:hypothetical protein
LVAPSAERQTGGENSAYAIEMHLGNKNFANQLSDHISIFEHTCRKDYILKTMSQKYKIFHFV